MEIYTLIREAKETNLISNEEIESLFSPTSEKSMFAIINNDSNELFSEVAEAILKMREDYKIAKHNDEMESFYKDISSKLKKILKTDKRKKLEDFLNLVSTTSEQMANIIRAEMKDPNTALFRLFFNEYNTKQIFTWRNFKDTKKQFEKNHPLEGENIYNLKSFLEKNTSIEKIDNNTVFSKEQGTLSDKCIEKLIEKFS